MGFFRVGNNETYTAPVSGSKIVGVTSVSATRITLRNAAGTAIFTAQQYQSIVAHQAQQLAIPGGWSIEITGGITHHASVSDFDA